MRLTPTEYTIRQFGNLSKMAQAIGCHHSAICRWKRKAINGEKGLVPSYLHRTILKEAKKRKLKITPNDLIYGRVIRKK